MKIKFINLNIWQGRLLEEAIEFIKSQKPDIVSLQEVYNKNNHGTEKRHKTFEIFKKELNFLYTSFAPAFIHVNEGKTLQGNAIFSNFSIIPEEIIFYDIPFGDFYMRTWKDSRFVPRNLQHVVIKIDDKKINVFNTQGIWGTDGKDNRRRLAMSRTIIDKIKNKQNVVLSGDFNVSPNTKTVGNIEKYLNNVFKDELITSFNMRRKDNPGYASAIVDMVFMSKNIKVLDHFCPQVDVSDHLPLVCVFEI
ncbi:MAG: endonuclease/exonuclease/phosphatase family protein [Patescibacteria group bacterium]|nr:endonuclease/exonuclease/phosphatase family protein [Patescibacteria group bacterium]